MKDHKEKIEEEVNQNLFDSEKDTRRVLKNNSPIMCMEFLLNSHQNSGKKENESSTD
jgi:hypothetical protein